MVSIKSLKNIYHYLAAHFGAVVYLNPSKKIFVVGVTGTKGKTTTIELINTGLEAAGYKTALSSSYREKIGSSSKTNCSNSMPGRFHLQKFLKEAVKEKCDFAIIEVTSEGVAQHRHRGIDFNAGIFTGLHPEHLESHGGFKNYREAKLSFFKYIKSKASKRNPKLFFINAEDWNAKKFISAARNLKGGKDGRYSYVYLFMRSHLPTKTSGFFNKINVGAAESFLMAVGISPDVIKSAFMDFEGVPGRMEEVQSEPFKVIVDYAHTPDSLENVYSSVKSETKEKMICVLGSAGGGRDKWKRPEFGRIAGKFCDEIILTSEDPYDEDPHKIIKDIELGIPKDVLRAGKTRNIEDRREAIKKAVDLAKAGDSVVITGKGSEPLMHLAGGRSVSWSDKRVAEEILADKRQR